MSDVKFGLWTVPESPVSIEYSLVVIEEIRHEVAEGYQRLSRGGIEVGGVLYGTHDGPVVRVLAIRPISCEHAHGPAFQLSSNDRAALDEQLMREQMDPRLAGMLAVGWFLSHTRTEVSLTESDLEIYSKFFPAPWQVALVIHPGRGGSMHAGFFVREENGAANGERSYLEFNFPDRLAGVLGHHGDRPPRERVPGGMRRPVSVQRAEPVAVDPDPRGSPFRRQAAPEQMIHEPMAQEQTAHELTGGDQPFPAVPSPLAPTRSSRRWVLLAVWVVLVLVAAVFGFRYWMMQPAATDPISLSVIEREGQLQVEWNHSARPVTTAIRGSLEIVDGSDTRTLTLMPQDLAAGKFTYARKTGDVEIRMTVESANGRKVQETSRFLGRPPASPRSEDLTALEQRRAELEAEVLNLRQGNNAQAARIQQLERTLRILQTRLGIDQGK